MILKNVLVSIGLPTFNNSVGLRKALEMLTSQSHRNLEILISDNASTDIEVENVGREFAAHDKRVCYFRQQKNIGMLDNFRYVKERARSDYFMWAADDDEWDPTFIEVCLENLLKSEKTVLSFCHYRRKNPQTGEIVNTDYHEPVESSSDSVLVRSFHVLMHSAVHSVYYGIYRKSAMSNWAFAHRFGQDHYAVLDVVFHGNIVISPLVLYTNSMKGRGFDREWFHCVYDSKLMKVCTNLSSTLVWFFEFLRMVWAEKKYSLYQKVVLSVFVLMRFMQFRFWRRFAGDLRSLITKPSIWRFQER